MMFLDWSKVKVFIKPGSTDMRKQINGLAIIVQEEMKYNPLYGGVFVFCNKRRKILKILYWERNGFCLWLKRLEKDKFPWPKDKDEARAIDYRELKMILEGIDFFSAHKEIKYLSIY